jgi:hypothetical protein
MNTRCMVIIAVSILAACCNRKSNNVLTLTIDKGTVSTVSFCSICGRN